MITVFTPTYNRAELLPRLYESLLSQTNNDFEWLIVDDGSSDNSEDLIKEWETEDKIIIRYFKQLNGGKHRAINKGVQLAKGSLFFIVDSDDYLPKESLMLIRKFSFQIMENKDFAGIAGNKCFPDGKKVGSAATYDVVDVDSVGYREKLHMKGDMAEVFKTKVLRKFPFPEFTGEKFITEAVVWNKIALEYKLRYFNQNIYICDYLEDGLSMNIRRHHRNSPKGTMLYYSTLTRDSRYGYIRHIKDAISYWRYTWNFRGKRILPPWWVWFFYPIGVAVYLNDRRRERAIQ